MPELREFILKACQFEQTKRYQSVPEAIETLHNAISHGSKKDSDSSGRGKLTTIILRYDQKQQAALNSLLSEFSIKTNIIGVDMKLLDLSE